MRGCKCRWGAGQDLLPHRVVAHPPGDRHVPPQPVPSDLKPPAPVDDAVVERKLREVRHENYFAILEVSIDAQPHTLRDAFQTQSRRFEAANIPPDVGQRWDEELREIRDAIADAWAVLGSDGLRERYARHHR